MGDYYRTTDSIYNPRRGAGKYDDSAFRESDRADAQEARNRADKAYRVGQGMRDDDGWEGMSASLSNMTDATEDVFFDEVAKFEGSVYANDPRKKRWVDAMVKKNERFNAALKESKAQEEAEDTQTYDLVKGNLNDEESLAVDALRKELRGYRNIKYGKYRGKMYDSDGPDYENETYFEKIERANSQLNKIYADAAKRTTERNRYEQERADKKYQDDMMQKQGKNAFNRLKIYQADRDKAKKSYEDLLDASSKKDSKIKASDLDQAEKAYKAAQTTYEQVSKDFTDWSRESGFGPDDMGSGRSEDEIKRDNDAYNKAVFGK
ncbi:MAG: hypothetical protein ACPH5P_00315 [Akkermansiaceae bacterium]